MRVVCLLYVLILCIEYDRFPVNHFEMDFTVQIPKPIFNTQKNIAKKRTEGPSHKTRRTSPYNIYIYIIYSLCCSKRYAICVYNSHTNVAHSFEQHCIYYTYVIYIYMRVYVCVCVSYMYIYQCFLIKSKEDKKSSEC